MPETTRKTMPKPASAGPRAAKPSKALRVKPDLAAIVAAATPAGHRSGERKSHESKSHESRSPESRGSERQGPDRAAAGRKGAGHKGAGHKGAEIVRLDALVAPPPAGTLKQRARQMSVYLEPPVYDQLRELAHAERAKMHALMLEGLDLLFRQRGARSIRQISEDGPR